MLAHLGLKVVINSFIFVVTNSMINSDNQMSFGLRTRISKLYFRTAGLFLILFASVTFQGCSVFKKKCDCPPVGKAPVRTVQAKAS